MSEPLIFITEHTVKLGRLKDLERLSEEFVEFGEANEPRLLAIRAYLDDEGDRFTLVQLHPDAESMDFLSKSPETRSTGVRCGRQRQRPRFRRSRRSHMPSPR
jgi:hypothetical protein